MLSCKGEVPFRRKYMKFRFRRLGAFFTDLLLCAMGAMLVSVLPAFLVSGLKLGKAPLAVLLAVMTLVFFIFHDFMDRSIGQKLFGLKVVSWSGKKSTPSQRIRRNLTVVIFPIELVLIIAGYDSLGDNLGLTCVTDVKSKTVPGMKKGNAVIKNAAIILTVSAILISVLVFSINYLRITGSDGYKALEAYLEGSVIKKEYGDNISWSVEGMEKISDERIVYSVSINARTVDVTAVKINDEWFVYGLQSKAVEKIEAIIEKTADQDTERYALADMDNDGVPELLEYFTDDKGAHISVYDLEGGNEVLCLDTKSQAGNSRGDWRVYKDTSEGAKNVYRLIGIYSSYEANKSEKIVCTASKADKQYSSIISFYQSVTAQETVDGEGNPTVIQVGEYRYNEIEMSPSDYFYNYDQFFEKYKPLTDVIAFEKWDSPEDGENQALIMAITLVKKGWDYTE